MRILITGSRTWTNIGTVGDALLHATRDDVEGAHTVVHGAAVGADEIAHSLALQFGWKTEAYRPDYIHHGGRATHIRNDRMVALGADLCLAFIRDRSPGATSCMTKAHRKGIPVVLWRHERHEVWLDQRAVLPAGVSTDQGSLF